MHPSTEIAVAVVEWNDHFLIGLRPEGKPLAGYWEFPGGRIEAGESPAEAAVRECQEETGVPVAALGPMSQVVHGYEHGHLEIHFIACRPLDPEQQPSAPFRWTPRKELSRLSFPPANAELLALLLTR